MKSLSTTLTNLIFFLLSSIQLKQVHGQAVNFTLHGNHLLERILDELPTDKQPENLQQIYNHGCWCSLLEISEKPIKPNSVFQVGSGRTSRPSDFLDVSARFCTFPHVFRMFSARFLHVFCTFSARFCMFLHVSASFLHVFCIFFRTDFRSG